jgi:hypothetical protein
MSINNLWDVVVIGGGPAGMMAAGRAAERGRSVLLLEKNSALGNKLLLTGGGRCNLTNNKPDVRAMLAEYKASRKFLFSAFSQFGVEETLNFFNQRGLITKQENNGRIFPAADNAQPVLDLLISYMKEGGVKIQTKVVVKDILVDASKKQISICFQDKTKIITKSCIVATGGTSYPKTGSTGDGLKWLQKIGHTIISSNFALVPIALKDSWIKKVSGITLENVKLTILLNDKKQGTNQGDLLFTHFGISGPTVLNISKDIGTLLTRGKVTINLDLFPNLDHGALTEKFQTLLVVESNKKLKNTLSKLLPATLIIVILELIGINGETANHSFGREERIKLVKFLKAMPLNVKSLLGADKAIASSGGVAPEEVDFKTMRSRLAPNIYIVGDALDIDRPSGGYSLQLCWTTGFVAGDNC